MLVMDVIACHLVYRRNLYQANIVDWIYLFGGQMGHYDGLPYPRGCPAELQYVVDTAYVWAD